MWINCSICGPRPLWAFQKAEREDAHFNLQYRCKDCVRKIMAEYRRLPNGEKRKVGRPRGKGKKLFKETDILKMMGVNLSQLVDTDIEGVEKHSKSVMLDENDMALMERIQEQFGTKNSSTILRVAFRYMCWSIINETGLSAKKALYDKEDE